LARKLKKTFYLRVQQAALRKKNQAADKINTLEIV